MASPPQKIARFYRSSEPGVKAPNAVSVGLWHSLVAATAFFILTGPAGAFPQTQRRPLEPPLASQAETPRHRTRLILKDGSYQSVISYVVKGAVVQYRSAERNGQREELPLSLVDMPATQAWARSHDPNLPESHAAQSAPVLSPELAREEAARAALTPEVAKDLRLPEGNSVLVLDTFRGTPELVPLPQNGSDLNRETGHAVLKREVNPASSPHDLLLVKDERADVQLHVAEPTFYVRLLDHEDGDSDSGSAFVVDTEGREGTSTQQRGATPSTFVLEHLDVRQGARAITSLRIASLGTPKQQPDIISVHQETLPGGVWQKLTPTEALVFGEYALVEVLGSHTVNAAVWDFGVHPTAKENDEALRPEPKRPFNLERRGP